MLNYTLFCSFSSLGKQENTVSKSLALKQSALSLACTEILQTVEVSVKSLFDSNVLSLFKQNGIKYLDVVHDL